MLNELPENDVRYVVIDMFYDTSEGSRAEIFFIAWWEITELLEENKRDFHFLGRPIQPQQNAKCCVLPAKMHWKMAFKVFVIIFKQRAKRIWIWMRSLVTKWNQNRNIFLPHRHSLSNVLWFFFSLSSSSCSRSSLSSGFFFVFWSPLKKHTRCAKTHTQHELKHDGFLNSFHFSSSSYMLFVSSYLVEVIRFPSFIIKPCTIQLSWNIQCIEGVFFLLLFLMWMSQSRNARLSNRREKKSISF